MIYRKSSILIFTFKDFTAIGHHISFIEAIVMLNETVVKTFCVKTLVWMFLFSSDIISYALLAYRPTECRRGAGGCLTIQIRAVHATDTDK